MSRNNILLGIVGVAVVGILFYSLSGNSTETQAIVAPTGEYANELTRQRKAKDEFFKTGKESPIAEKERATFGGLHYFEPDSTWRIWTRFTRIAAAQSAVVKMSQGEEEAFKIAGKVMFERDGKIHMLTLFVEPSRRMFFLPFRDATSGTDTYGGGRYLDIPMGMVRNDSLLIDFNVAYNPYCAYNYEFTCPVPPDENRLSIAVKAGEKNYK
ncbi:MAG: DUF1684 domain-containing protein [Spirosomataceae bacterium]